MSVPFHLAAGMVSLSLEKSRFSETICKDPGEPLESSESNARHSGGLICAMSFPPSCSVCELSSSALRLVQFVVREGHFNVSMRLYKSPSYLQPYHLPSVAVPLTDTLYVLLKIEGQHQVKYFLLSVLDCWATPSSDPHQDVQHKLIEQG